MGCCHNFGLGINWLRGFAPANDDQRRDEVLRKSDLPPMFKPRCGLHQGEINVTFHGYSEIAKCEVRHC